MKHSPIAIICAMETEAQGLLEKMTEKKEETVGSIRFFVGELCGQSVVLSVCGIGKVFAAICAQTAILHYHPRFLVNSGVAGSLDEELDIFSLAIPHDFVQHDMDTTALGDPAGMISGINLVRLPADAFLAKKLEQVAKEAGHHTKSGTLVSGDQFIHTKEKKAALRAAFDPIACEMEGAAIAQVAFVNAVPFAALRVISDSFSGKNEMDYAAFAPRAASLSAAVLLSFLQSLNS